MLLINSFDPRLRLAVQRHGCTQPEQHLRQDISSFGRAAEYNSKKVQPLRHASHSMYYPDCCGRYRNRRMLKVASPWLDVQLSIQNNGCCCKNQRQIVHLRRTFSGRDCEHGWCPFDFSVQGLPLLHPSASLKIGRTQTQYQTQPHSNRAAALKQHSNKNAHKS